MGNGFDALIKVRCYRSLVRRLERLADHPKIRRTLPDLCRLALADYATEQEAKLGLKPIEEDTKFLIAAEDTIPYKATIKK